MNKSLVVTYQQINSNKTAFFCVCASFSLVYFTLLYAVLNTTLTNGSLIRWANVDRNAQNPLSQIRTNTQILQIIHWLWLWIRETSELILFYSIHFFSLVNKPIISLKYLYEFCVQLHFHQFYKFSPKNDSYVVETRLNYVR